MLIALACALAGGGTAEAQESRHVFSIPAQPALESLQAFARQTGVQLLFPYDAVSGKQAPAIAGTLADSEVLQRLAAAAGLVVSSNDGRTITLVRRPPLALAAGSTNPPAPTAVAATPGLEVIVVTAQKRAENLQDVPIAVTAVASDQLQARGVANTMQLNQVIPGLNMTEAIGTYGLPFIRGIGTTSQGAGVENPVATYIDGVYVYGTAGTVLELHDLDQIAVLKGPQGTLFGRNSTGGVIQYTTKAPSHTPYVEADATYGNLGADSENFYATGGLNGQIAANVAIAHDEQDQGFGRNLYNGEWVYTYRDSAVRAKLLWQPDNQTDVTLSTDYSYMDSAEPVNRMAYRTVLNAPMPGGPWNTDLNVQPRSQVEAGGDSLTVKRDLGFAQAVSITAYRFDRIYNQFDADGATLAIEQLHGPAYDAQWSQELQLLSPAAGRLTWVTGLFFLGAHSWNTSDNCGWFFGAGPCTDSWSLSQSGLFSSAVFGQAAYALDDATKFTAGLRYSWDTRTGEQTTYNGNAVQPTGAPTSSVEPAAIHFGDPTWRLSLDRRLSSELMVYVSFNHGFRSGQFGSLGKAATATSPAYPATPANPETLDAFETGIKVDLLNNHLRIDAAAYYYLDHNRVSFQIINGASTLLDAKLATLYGTDADAIWRFNDAFTVNAGIELEHAAYTSFGSSACTPAAYQFGCGVFLYPAATPSLPQNNFVLTYGDDTGKSVESTPSMTLNISPAYRQSSRIGQFRATLNYYYNNGWYAAPDNYAKQGAYSTLAAEVLWLPSYSKALSLRVWGKNLTNTNYAQQYTETTPGPNYQVGPGRTYGVTLGVQF